ncbi:MAG TPA: hypothetical protein VD886_09135 [Herpetosiphonaceae bacterium]|nr:hypothetical protein [Herpetosiphonaceae bacterium]
MDLPDGLRALSAWNGRLNGTLTVICTRCRAALAIVGVDGPQFNDTELRGMAVGVARQMNIAALAERAPSKEIVELWPEERVRKSNAAWSDLLGQHECKQP